MAPLPYSAQSMELCAITGNGKKLNIAQNKWMAMPRGLKKLAHTGISVSPAVPFTNTCANNLINHVAILLKHVERYFSYIGSSIK